MEATPDRPRIAAVGDNCIDVYVGDFAGRFPGGNALNVAAFAAQDGLDAAYVGTVGNDDDGSALLAAATAAGIDVSMVERRPGASGVTTVRLVNGEREFLTEEYGASLAFDVDARLAERLDGYDWVHTSRIEDRDDHLGSLVRTGVPVSRDFGTELRCAEPDGHLVRHLAVAFFSAADRVEAESRAADLVGLGAERAVGTIGPEGALVRTADTAHHEPAAATDPVDTLGAGDAFIAGFIGATLNGGGLEGAMRVAATAAARACARLGAWGALEPTGASPWK